MFGMTGEALANRLRGEAAGEALKCAELTYTTPAPTTRCKLPVRHKLGACKTFPLMNG